MAISDTITSMYENVGNVYDVLELAGADLTNVDKNIENLKQSWEERLLYFLANGTDTLWNNWLPKVNGTGESITLNNTIQAKMNFVYKGNTSQNGEPTPDTPIPVNVVTGDNSITISNGDNTQSQTYPINLGSMELCKIGDYQDVIKRSSGKNLFDKTTITSGQYVNQYGTMGTDATVFVSDYIEITPNTDYYISGRTIWNSVGLYDSSKTFIERPNYTATGILNISNTNVKYIRINASLSDINTLMLNEGTTALPYEPYGKVWYKYGAIGKVVLDGSENWNASGNDTNTQRYATNVTTYGVMSASNGYCNNNRYVSSGVSMDEQLCGISSGIYYYRLNQGILSEYSATIFKEWVANNNITNYIPLITPTITPITDTTLIEQLDNLEKAYSYDTQTNISQTNQDKPFIISYEAILSLRNVLNSLETRIAVLETE